MGNEEMNSTQALEAAYADPRFRAMLGVIRDAEGASRYADPYRVAEGGKSTLSQLDTPEFRMWGFTDKTGKSDMSSATGAYQFLRGTWKDLQNRYGFRDFQPRTQDLAALALMKDAGAFPYVQRGDYMGALNKVRTIWASLPGAGHNQQERGMKFLQDSLAKHLGQPVNMQNTPRQTSRLPLPSEAPVANGDIAADPYAQLFNVELGGVTNGDISSELDYYGPDGPVYNSPMTGVTPKTYGRTSPIAKLYIE